MKHHTQRPLFSEFAVGVLLAILKPSDDSCYCMDQTLTIMIFIVNLKFILSHKFFHHEINFCALDQQKKRADTLPHYPKYRRALRFGC